ncbi:MAG: response regulator [Bacteroidetes bacterium]|nr:response regulator [Bacteroidota bacterium]
MKKILIIDDEQDFRNALSQSLQLDGFECIAAGDGKEAITLALTQYPDIVLCDISMPGMNGFETLMSFRSQDRLMTIPFIFLTGQTESGLMRHGMDLGADDFLTKPVTASEVTTAVNVRLNRLELLATQGEENVRKMRVRLEELRRLAEVTKQINDGVLMEEVCEQVFSAFKSFIPFNRIGVSLIDEDSGMVVAQWAKTDSKNIVISKGYHQLLKGSSLEDILRSRQPRIINDLEEYFRIKPQSKATEDILNEGILSSLTCPLIAMGKNIGFIFFSSNEKNTYRFEHTEIYVRLAGQLAVVLEKARLYQQLIELNITKDKFIGIAAHDLRNPLGAIIGFSELMKEDPVIINHPELAESVEFISMAGNAALALINDLLDYAAIESGHLTIEQFPVELQSFLLEAVTTHQMFSKAKNITISSNIAADLPASVNMDRRRIRQVLDNFISNALKYSHTGTHIDVRLTLQNGSLRCDVSDQGQGIPEAELSKLFHEYSRTSVQPTAGEKSTGLGLAIVKKIIKEHGGEVGATSTVGKGSTFFFVIPLV